LNDTDDHSCRIWDLETGQDVSSLLLKSPGVAVKWHNQVHDEVKKNKRLHIITDNIIILMPLVLETANGG